MKSKEEIPKLVMLDIPEPVGNFIINNAEPLMLPDGGYYHYTKVCSLLTIYADQQTESLRKEVERLKGIMEEIMDIPADRKNYDYNKAWHLANKGLNDKYA